MCLGLEGKIAFVVQLKTKQRLLGPLFMNPLEKLKENFFLSFEE
jgi:hypothetical protein